MRVAELQGPRRFVLTDQPIAAPGPGEVQVRVRAVGVCGSDMHAYSEGGIGGLPCQYPMVLGHEPAGEIATVGAGVTGVSAGDRVVCEPAVYCYHCARCREGRHNLCERIRFLSLPGEPGFLRDMVNLPVANVFPLPPALSFVEGGLVEPLAVVLHSLRLAGSVLGDRVVVSGAGPIGLLTVAALRLAGAARVFAVEPLVHRRALALAMGADDAAADFALVKDVDLAVDCAAKADTANQCISAVRPGGRVVFTGIPSEAQLHLDVHQWRRKELALVQVRRSNREAEAALHMLATHAALFAPLLTHTRPLPQVGDAFDIVERYADGVGKMTVVL